MKRIPRTFAAHTPPGTLAAPPEILNVLGLPPDSTVDQAVVEINLLKGTVDLEQRSRRARTRKRSHTRFGLSARELKICADTKCAPEVFARNKKLRDAARTV